jgi:hypothetical protein
MSPSKYEVCLWLVITLSAHLSGRPQQVEGEITGFIHCLWSRNFRPILDLYMKNVVRDPGYRFRGQDWIPGLTRFSEKQWVWNGAHSAS